MYSFPREIMELYCERFSEIPLAILDHEGNIIHANRAFLKRLNLDRIPEGESVHSLLHINLFITDPLYRDPSSGIVVDLVTASFSSLGETSTLRGHLLFDGSRYVVIFDIYKQHDVEIIEQVTRINLEMTSLTRDYSKQYRAMNKQAEANKVLAHQDPLTKLGNRRHFENIIEKTIKDQAEPKEISFGIIIFDIDNFKRVNDTFGHDTGDIVLKMLSNTILETIRQNDTPARYGGEEFIILAQSDSLDSLFAFAEKLRSTFESLYIPAIDSSVTASFGITMYQEGDDIASLIKRADQAMYRAKSKGKNRVEC